MYHMCIIRKVSGLAAPGFLAVLAGSVKTYFNTYVKRVRILLKISFPLIRNTYVGVGYLSTYLNFFFCCIIGDRRLVIGVSTTCKYMYCRAECSFFPHQTVTLVKEIFFPTYFSLKIN